MTTRDPAPAVLQRLAQQETLNFWLTNRIPRQLLTRFMGWFSKIEQPLVRDLSIAVWKAFSDLDLGEAADIGFKSMHACFTRRLKEGVRPIDPDPRVFVSPCDAIVGACGVINDVTLIQAKGYTYTLEALLRDPSLADQYRNGRYVTLRLTSSMYHRFHAPQDCSVEHVTYIAGDCWNVNPVALKRIDKLFCKNERAVIRARLHANGARIALVPVAAVLVASIRLHCLDARLHLRYRGPDQIDCSATYRKGQEMGWFEHGSTIIVLTPAGYTLSAGVAAGVRIRMGEALLALPRARSRLFG